MPAWLRLWVQHDPRDALFRKVHQRLILPCWQRHTDERTRRQLCPGRWIRRCAAVRTRLVHELYRRLNLHRVSKWPNDDRRGRGERCGVHAIDMLRGRAVAWRHLCVTGSTSWRGLHSGRSGAVPA